MKKITILNFHPAFTPPRSGGELRYWNIATQLAQSFDVRMINPTFGDAQREDVQHAANCIETRLPKTRAYNKWHHFFDRVAKFPECSALVSTLAVKSHREYVELAREHAASSDIVMFSSPFMARVYPRAKPGQLLVYDSYNVEAKLAAESLGHGFWGRWGANRIGAIEGELAREADVVLVCSREDGAEMCDIHQIDGSQIVFVPNGVNVDEVLPPDAMQRAAAREHLQLSGDTPALIFLGSFHPPNIEALAFILSNLAPLLKDAVILVAGKVCEAAAGRSVPANVRMLGLVDEETKRAMLHGGDIALNPMFSGSGTNLKMLEFLASGLPIVTTPFGARGLEMQHGETAMVVESSIFVPCIEALIGDIKRREAMGAAARRHAEENFAWNNIGKKLRDLFQLKTSRRIVMLNDYPVTPVNSGGKVRLAAVARHLSETVAPVTMLTLTKSFRGKREMLAPKCEEINIPRSEWLKALDKILYTRTNRVGLDDVCAVFGWRLAGAMRRRLRRELQWADALVLEHCYMVNFAREYAGKLPIIYESHNVEAVLKRSVYPQSGFGKWLLRRVETAEKRACELANFVATVSEADRVVFNVEFRIPREKLVVAPNGVDCCGRIQVPIEKRHALRRAVGMKGEPTMLFLGSGHPPNRDAVTFILKELAPNHPQGIFLVAGSVCGWFHSMRIPENVILLGEIDNAAKEFLLQACDIALNPLFDGSGSSLKVPEYLSAGIPVLSSEIGARGFATRDTAGLMICDTRDMSARLGALMMNPAARAELASAGRALAEEQFDWSVTLKSLETRLRDVMRR